MLVNEEREEVNDLVRDLKDGNKESMDSLYVKLYRAIFYSLKKYTNNNELIKDVIGDTFIELYKKPKSQIQFINCYNLILKMAKNRILNLIKYDQRYDYIDDENSFINDLECSSSRYEGLVEWQIVLEDLPLQDKKLFYLRSVNKLKFNKIAEILNVSERTVKRKYKDFKTYVEEIMKNEK